jgi:hypothetical protein
MNLKVVRNNKQKTEVKMVNARNESGGGQVYILQFLREICHELQISWAMINARLQWGVKLDWPLMNITGMIGTARQFQPHC